MQDRTTPKKPHKRMTEREYDETKLAIRFFETQTLKGRATPISEAAKLKGRTTTVIKLIAETADFDEYRAVREKENSDRKNGNANLNKALEAAGESKPEAMPELNSSQAINLLTDILKELQQIRADNSKSPQEHQQQQKRRFLNRA